jgi:hypothetical protein
MTSNTAISYPGTKEGCGKAELSNGSIPSWLPSPVSAWVCGHMIAYEEKYVLGGKTISGSLSRVALRCVQQIGRVLRLNLLCLFFPSAQHGCVAALVVVSLPCVSTFSASLPTEFGSCLRIERLAEHEHAFCLLSVLGPRPGSCK